ncbi:MAG: trimeric intracellular cation channel family protein [Chitinophagaceae bacterium]|nr:trimeric intracellular cation channel family protein [Chitinophagaceae bacterium]
MNFFDILTYSGTFVFAITGATKARTQQMDIFGGAVLAFATAYGGGTIRDLLIGIRPVNWINDYIALALVFSAVVITFLIKGNIHQYKRMIFITDAIGLGLFTAAGISISLQHGVNAVYALIMGIISATFGGVIADILRNEVPDLLKRGELYATACFIGGTVFLLGRPHIFNEKVNLGICVCVIVIIRIISKYKRLTLPQI